VALRSTATMLSSVKIADPN